MILGKTFLKKLCKISCVCCDNSLFYLLTYSKFASRAATWRVLRLQLFRAVLTSYNRYTRRVAAQSAMFSVYANKTFLIINDDILSNFNQLCVTISKSASRGHDYLTVNV